MSFIDHREMLIAILVHGRGTAADLELRVREMTARPPSEGRWSFERPGPIHFPVYPMLRALTREGFVQALPGKAPHSYELTPKGISYANSSRGIIGRIFGLIAPPPIG